MSPTARARRLAPLLLVGLLVTTGTATGGAILKALPGAPPFPAGLRLQLEQELARRGNDAAPRTQHRHADGRPIYSNRLLLEPSPYLQQHAHNPVNWYPWGDEAFADAARLGRPVFVSIGYSTCHWCHVMEEETFDSTTVAAYLNAHFIAIKVDREARPDVDSIYMSALHAMGQQGGWPLNVWLTASGEPFYGGTYFPPVDRAGRPGFMSVLERIHVHFSEQPDAIAQSAAALARALEAELEGRVVTQSAAIGSDALDRALRHYQQAADRTWGGVGRRTKFPSSLPIRLLLREHRRTGNPDALALATLTLEKMAAGGLHDQLGGGFHRYSTERTWLVPHFEKMLYDNALLAVAYLEAAQVTGRPDFTAVARRTLDYVMTEMTDPAGGFYSATDADSRTPEGELEEGWYFTWTPAEIEAVLGKQRARIATAWYGVSPGGQLEGRSILHTSRSQAEVASMLGMSEDAFAEARTRVDRDLLAARAGRTPPLRDDKILAAWNGLMISALARAGFALNEPRYVGAARRAAIHVLDTMRTGDRLHRVSLGGRASGPAFLDDYAFMIAGLLDLFEADPDPRWLDAALSLQHVLDTHYADADTGGYFAAADDAVALLAREKPSRDEAVPSGNSVAASNLLRLSTLTLDDRFAGRLAMLESALHDGVQQSPASFAQLLLTVSDQQATMREVIIVSPPVGGDMGSMLAPLRDTYVPNRVLAVTREGAELEQLEAQLPLVSGRRAVGGRTTAYVCENRVCQYPTNDPQELRAQLKATRQSTRSR